MIREKVNLLDPEEVKLFIKRHKNWSDRHKVNAVYAYNDFCKMMKISLDLRVRAIATTRFHHSLHLKIYFFHFDGFSAGQCNVNFCLF
jgi:hypothetical protein